MPKLSSIFRPFFQEVRLRRIKPVRAHPASRSGWDAQYHSPAFGRSQNIKLRKTLNVAKKEGSLIILRLFGVFVVKKNDAEKLKVERL
jgi:hypothetical protein